MFEKVWHNDSNFKILSTDYLIFFFSVKYGIYLVTLLRFELTHKYPTQC